MKLVTRTLVAGINTIARDQGHNQPVHKLTTFNEHLEIGETLRLEDKEYTSLKGIMIGDGAHTVTQTDSGKLRIQPVKHRPRQTNLYNSIPFVLRRENDDLTLDQQKGYGLRKVIEIKGTFYIAYFLKRIINDNDNIELSRISVVDGVEQKDAITFTSEDASPSVPNINLDNATPVELLEEDYVSADNVLTIPFTEFDVQELLNVSKIIDGVDGDAIFSELAIVHGVDRNVQVSGPGGESYTFNEVAVAQAVTYISEYHSYASKLDSETITVNVGVTESMLVEHHAADIPNAATQL